MQGRNTLIPKKVFIGNLSYKSTKENIEIFFKSCESIKLIDIAKQEDGKSKGFCFVEFETKEGANEALKLAGQELDGRNIKVRIAESKEKREFKRSYDKPEGSFRGNRGGRGGFRGGRGGFRGGNRRFRGNKRGRSK